MTSTIPLAATDLRDVHAFYRRVRGGAAAPRLRPCETVAELAAWLTSGPWGLAGDVTTDETEIVGVAALTQFVPWQSYATTAELTIACHPDVVPSGSGHVVDRLIARALERAAATHLHCLSTFLVDEESALRDGLLAAGFSHAGAVTMPADATDAIATTHRMSWLWRILGTDVT